MIKSLPFATSLAALAALAACASITNNGPAPQLFPTSTLPTHLAQLVAIAHDPAHPYVLVEAHRGSFTVHRPENSVSSIEHAIAIGVDIIEIDIRKTKDGQFVLMHDATLDRTTTLSGPVTDYTLEQITAAPLVSPVGRRTHEHAPTLEEALDLMRDRVLMRLDIKCGVECENEIYPIVIAKGMMDQAVIGERHLPYAEQAGLSPDQVIVYGQKIDAYDAPSDVPAAVDYIQVKDFDADAPPVEKISLFAQSIRITSFPYDDKRAGGRGDIRSETHPDAGWGWLVDRGADILLTDTPAPLIEYLEQRGLRER